MNNRRRIAVLLAIGTCTPQVTFAQRPEKVWRVGFLSFRKQPDALDNDFYGGFTQGMRELGYVQGRNLAIEWRFADGSRKKLVALAQELVTMKVDVIVTAGSLPTREAKAATTTIPIVMGAGVDPVAGGLVASLARPGGNVTGLTNLASDLRPKHLEMLLGILPKMRRVAILVNSSASDNERNLKIFQDAVQKTQVFVLPLTVQTAEAMESAFARAIRERAEALIVTLNPLFVQHGRQIAELAMTKRLPSIAPNREYVEAGGLMSYGQNQAGSYRRAATYVDKILKGAKPGDLPVEQPMGFEMAVNLKTAKVLGVTMPAEIMVQATQVIQ